MIAKTIAGPWLRSVRTPFIGILASVVLGATAFGRATVSLDDIAEALARREAALRSGDASWVESNFVPRNSISLDVSVNDRDAVPDADTTTEAQSHFVWHDEKQRFSYDGQVFGVAKMDFVAIEYASVANGRTGTRDLTRDASVEYPRGLVAKKRELPIKGYVNLKPILLWCRPLSPEGASIPIRFCRMLPGRQDIDGNECVGVRFSQNGQILEWYFDPQKDFAVARYSVTKNERPVVKVDTSYSLRDRMWIPVKWRVIVHSPSGNLIHDTAGALKSVTLNQQIPAARFELDFPPGTWVNDEVKGYQYLATNGGGERVITRSELLRGAKYRELADSSPGFAHASQPATWRSWAIGIAAVLAGASIVTHVARRIHRAACVG